MSDTNRTGAVDKTFGDFKDIGNAAKQTGWRAMNAGSDALGQARDVAKDAPARAGSMLGAMGEQASSVAETQKANLADRIEDMAKAVHKSGEQLEGQGEIRLAWSEFDQKLDCVIMAAIFLLGGALVAFSGLVVVLEGDAAALAQWAASLIVGLLIVGVGALFARSGLSMLSLKTLTPDRTAASLQKDARVMKEHT